MKQPNSSTHVVRISLLVDVLDVALNVLVAIITGSAVMVAEALQGTADLATTALLLVGIKSSKRGADTNHPFGHGREVYFWTLMSGILMLAITATTSFYNGLQHILHPQIIEDLSAALFVLGVGIISNSYAFYLSFNRLTSAHKDMPLWEIISTSSLIEVKATFILDLIGTLSAAVGLVSLFFVVLTGSTLFDGIGAMGIGISMALLSTLLILDVKDLLVGRGAPSAIEQDIKETALAIKGVEAVLDLRTMYIGSDKLLVNLELDIAPHLETAQIERLVDIIKAELKAKVPSVHHVQIELETPVKRGSRD